jgi:hypothetical protein
MDVVYVLLLLALFGVTFALIPAFSRLLDDVKKETRK